MGFSKWNDIKKNKDMAPERKARLEAEAKTEVLAVQLRELREMAGMTQVETAKIASMTQAELSRLERREDHLVSTLRRYVEALGGTIEVVAVLGNKRVALTGV
jgi:hypothetical protein